MRKALLTLAALCLGVALSAGALAADSGGSNSKNPVVDLSSLVNPGLWETTGVRTVNGKKRPQEKSTQCITSAELHDFFNQGDSEHMQVEDYRLEGNHMHVKAALLDGSGKRVGHVTFDETFDDRNHQHGTSTFVLHHGKTAINSSQTMKSRRTGPCKSGGSDSH